MAAIPNEVFTAFSFVAFIMCCIPFPWHLEAWNTGTCLYMAWAAIANLNQFINSIVWNGNAINWAPVWCDISSRIIIGTAVAIPAASLCINRRLYHIASVRAVTVTKAEKRRQIMVDLAIGLGIPILEMILQYIPQGHRFNIFEDVGCLPFTYSTPVALVIVGLPPVLIGCVSAIYSVLSIRAFAKSHTQFKELLSSNNNLTPNRYLRLMMLAGIETLLTLPFGLWAIYENTKDGNMFPWKGWADTHLGFSRVDQVPAILWRNSPASRGLELTRFFTILCALIFFAFFGFAEEARKNYRSAAQSIAKRVGASTASSGTLFSSTGSKTKSTSNMSSTGGQSATFPVFVERHTVRKHDSLDSFSDMSASFNDVGGFLDDEKKTETLSIPPSYDGLQISDVGGTLADFRDGPYSPTPSSGSSSASSVVDSPTSLSRSESSLVEISSVRYSTTITMPQPSFNPSSPRHVSDSSAV